MLASRRYIGVAWLLMSEEKKSKLPYSQLGQKLRHMRISRQESLAEVSGAVEVEIETLRSFEQGSTCPTEDILLLLINHFDLKEQEADRLWKLAGFDDNPFVTNDAQIQSKQLIAVSAEDLKIVYTDMVHVSANNFGVIMNFLQSGGPGSQPLAISRVGMSREHAEIVLALLQKTLEATRPNALPAPKSSAESQELNQ